MKRIAVMTSGGDSQGMNAAIYGVVRFGLSNGLDVFGIQRGYEGLINGEIIPMDAKSVENIMHCGGTVLGTSRCPQMKTVQGQRSAADVLKKHGIEGLVVIGGDGSFQGAKVLSTDYGIQVIGIPGTIDNDLAYTDFTLGFDSAVTVVVNTVKMLRDTMGCNGRSCVVEVMGRNCGDIALYSALTSSAEVVVVPEVGYNPDGVAARLRQNIAHGKTDNMIIVAEGAVKAQTVLDDVVARLPGINIRSMVVGHLQRGGNATYRDIYLGVRMGVHAVKCLVGGKTNRVVGVHQDRVFDQDILEALSLTRPFDTDLYSLANQLVDSF